VPPVDGVFIGALSDDPGHAALDSIAMTTFLLISPIALQTGRAGIEP
jgi:hypothetical protein